MGAFCGRSDRWARDVMREVRRLERRRRWERFRFATELAGYVALLAAIGLIGWIGLTHAVAVDRAVLAAYGRQ